MTSLHSITKGNKPKLPAPKDRTKCAACKKPLPIEIGIDRHPQNGRTYTGLWRYDAYGFFCSLRCGTAYANALLSESRGKRPNDRCWRKEGEL